MAKQRRPLIIETKTVDMNVLALDTKTGIADAVVNVFGIVDLGRDRILNGAFKMTISERAGKIRVLDSHRMDTVRAIIGKPLEIKELNRAGLPQEIRDKFPEATGGLFTKTQFAIDTEDGDEIFKRIASGIANEWSIGFDLLQSENVSEVIDEEEVIIRNIQEVRLWEYSVVTFGMNQATQTVRSMMVGNPNEPGKLLLVRELDDGLLIERAAFPFPGERRDCKIVGESGVTASIVCNGGKEGIAGFTFEPNVWERKNAIEWVQYQDDMALHGVALSEQDGQIILNSPSGLEPEAAKEMTDDGPVQRLGDILVGHLHQTFSMLGDGWLISGIISKDEHKKFVKAAQKAIDAFTDTMPETVMVRRKPENDFFFFSNDEPEVIKETEKGTEQQPDEVESNLLAFDAQKLELYALQIKILESELGD